MAFGAAEIAIAVGLAAAAGILAGLWIGRARAAVLARGKGPVPAPARGDDRIAASIYRSVVDLLDDGVCIIDRAGTVLRANRAFADLAGVAENQLRGCKLSRLLSKGSESFAPDGPIALTLKANRPATGMAGPCRFGEQVRVTAIPLGPLGSDRSNANRWITANGQGGSDLVAVVIRDVTEAVGQEGRARRLGHLVAALPILVIEVDPATERIRFVNGAFCDALGYTELEANEMMLDALFSSSSLNAPQKLRESVFQGGGPVVAEFQKRDRSTFPARIHGTLLRRPTGAPDAMVLMVEDITFEKEAALQNELLAAAVENSKDGIIVTDLSGRIRYANAAAGALYAKPAEALVGAHFTSYHSGDGSEEISHDLSDSIDEHEGWTGDLIRHMADETNLPTRVTISPVRQRGTEGLLAFVAILHDLTKEREMQEQVLRAQKLVTLGELAATINHEISNPLTYLLSSAVYVAQEIEQQPVDEEVRAAANDCLEGARRIQRIVTEVRRFAHMGRGDSQVTSYDSAISSALALAGPRIREFADVVRTPGSVPDIQCDPGHLVQVLMNLVVNATQAFEDAHRRGTIRFEQRLDGDEVVLEVSDDGPGIPESVRARLFQDYVTTKERGRGTGFGLRISHKLIEESKGSIGVESTVGVGTKFTLRLRRAEPAPEAEVIDAPEPSFRGRAGMGWSPNERSAGSERASGANRR